MRDASRVVVRFDDTFADTSEPLARLFHGAARASERIVHRDVWFRGAHNNMRYDALAASAVAYRQLTRDLLRSANRSGSGVSCTLGHGARPA